MPVLDGSVRSYLRAFALGVGLAATGCVGRPWAPKDVGSEDAAGGDSNAVYNYDRGEPGRSASVRVEVERRFQTLDGYGAATAWFQDRIVGKTPDGLYELLFPDLGLDILRLRNRYNRLEEGDRDVDVDLEVVARATRALGHPPRVLLTSWSPPAKLKASGAERCRSNPDCTLARKKGKFVYEEFATYWEESLRDYAKRGLTPDFVSIQNEPDFTPPDWEGCRFVPKETSEYPGYDRALTAVHARLQKLPHPPALIGPETIGVHYDKVESYLASLDQSLLYAVAHHLYEQGSDGVWDWRNPGPDSYSDELRGVSIATKQRVWQTEFETGDDKGKEGGFETALIIHNVMVEGGASAFVYWNLVWDGMSGLVGMLGRRPRVRDQYFAVRHFARYTDPGYVRVAAWSPTPELRASAWLAPDESRLAVVLINAGEDMLDVTLDVPGYAASRATTHRTTYRPGESERWTDLGEAGRSGIVRMPGRSQVTVAFER